MQIIVVDNGSRDGSASLDSEFPAAQFIRLPQNFGLTKALNIGIRACDGSYVLFLHEDVEITPEAVELLRAELEQHSDTQARLCPLLLDEAGKPLPQIRALPAPADPDPQCSVPNEARRNSRRRRSGLAVRDHGAASFDRRHAPH